MITSAHRFCVAPMMDWTDRHCRYFHRLLTRHARLYTEMVTAEAVIHGDRERLLGFDPAEQPVALQLGGADADRLAMAAAIGAQLGYAEINLNVGCPSDRVQEGRFGACLMAEPDLVARCVAAMQRRVAVPVTIKCRIGIDDQDSEADFQRFVDGVAGAGCSVFIVHARKAWLSGLSPKENREIPPLDYDRVYRLKAARPDLTVVVNGGITTIEAAERHLAHVDGVMLGRAAYRQPYLLAEVVGRLFGDAARTATGGGVLGRGRPYLGRPGAAGGRASNITRHILGLYHGRPRGRLFRRVLSEQGTGLAASGAALIEAMRMAEHGGADDEAVAAAE